MYHFRRDIEIVAEVMLEVSLFLIDIYSFINIIFT